MPAFELIDVDLHLTDWAAVAQIALAATALVALIIAVVQIMQARSSSRQTLTYNYTHRFSEPDLLPYHQKTAEWFKAVGTESDKRYAEFEELGREEKLAVLVVPNLFEELAGVYNQGLLDKRIAKEFFGGSAARVWKSGSWLIDRCREDDGEYYREWELMLKDMELL